MLRNRLLVAERAQTPFARRMCVGHGLERREGLRRNDKQGLGWIEVARRLGEVGAINVRYKAHGEITIAVMAQRLVRHHRAEVGTANADIDDRTDPPAGMARPCAAAD